MNRTRLLQAYLATEYCWQAGTAWICCSVGKLSPAATQWLRLQGAHCLAIFGASHPYSLELGPRQNLARHAALEGWLRRRGLTFFPAEGRPRRPSRWPVEPAVAVLRLSPGQTRALLSQWRQNCAVYLRTGHHPILLWNPNGKRC